MNAATQTPVRTSASFSAMRPTRPASPIAKKPPRSFLQVILKALSAPNA